jgi:hypothetical protein
MCPAKRVVQCDFNVVDEAVAVVVHSVALFWHRTYDADTAHDAVTAHPLAQAARTDGGAASLPCERVCDSVIHFTIAVVVYAIAYLS